MELLQDFQYLLIEIYMIRIKEPALEIVSKITKNGEVLIENPHINRYLQCSCNHPPVASHREEHPEHLS